MPALTQDHISVCTHSVPGNWWVKDKRKIRRAARQILKRIKVRLSRAGYKDIARYYKR